MGYSFPLNWGNFSYYLFQYFFFSFLSFWYFLGIYVDMLNDTPLFYGALFIFLNSFFSLCSSAGGYVTPWNLYNESSLEEVPVCSVSLGWRRIRGRTNPRIQVWFLDQWVLCSWDQDAGRPPRETARDADAGGLRFMSSSDFRERWQLPASECC